MLRRYAPRRKRAIGIALFLAAFVAAVVFRRVLLEVAQLLIGAALVAFLAEPLCRQFEKKLPRSSAALAGLATIGLAVFGALWLATPVILREIAGLAQALPDSLERISDWARQITGRLSDWLPGFAVPDASLADVLPPLPDIAAGAMAAAANIADIAARAALALALSYFLLRDRERLLLRLEMLLPQSVRHGAVGFGNGLLRELRVYLRGQLLIALAVAVLAAAGLAAIGVRSPLVLGPIVGLLNMIPYFGPYIGGIPAVLVALNDGWQKTLMAVAVLAAVQQADGWLISPRIMGGLTGFSPGLVLVGIFAGAQVAGVAGMLLAMPVMMLVRALYKFSVQRAEKTSENI